MARPLPLLMEDGRETTAKVDEISPEAAFSMTAGSADDGCSVPPRTNPSPSSGYESGGPPARPPIERTQNEALINDLSIVYVLLLVSACYHVRSDQGHRQGGE